VSAEQVLRCIVIKILFAFTYEDLAFHIVDSQSLRWFCRFGMVEEGFRKSVLNRNIKGISHLTWQMINRDILMMIMGLMRKALLNSRQMVVQLGPTPDKSRTNPGQISNPSP
jgi:Transposase domain (DUF772)